MESSADKLLRYLKLVQKPGRLELLVLRAHMLAEEHLRAVIDRCLPAPEHFKHKSFGYAQCSSLAIAMYWKPSNDWIWECLALLKRGKEFHGA